MSISMLTKSNVPRLAWILCLTLFTAPLICPAKTASNGDRQKAAERLISDFDTLEQFEAAAKDAAKAGISDQAIAEVKLVFCCVNDITAPLPQLTRQVRSTLSTWKEQDSLLFKERQELEGLLSFAQALLAEQANDEAGFEQPIKEAFWLNPTLASLCKKKIQRHWAMQRQAKLVLPMDLTIPLSTGGQTTLSQIVKDHQAILLDFWASWCAPCMSLMDDLRARAHKLAGFNIVVAAINTEAGGEDTDLGKAKANAERVKKTKKMDLPWLVEPEDSPLSRLLEIDSIPRAVLISPDGKILYNGHPSDAGLLTALEKLDVRQTDTTRQ